MSRSTRIYSIDVFRALTMFLMIFVNDVAGVEDIPQWIKHTTAEEDGMGLSDIVFPLFLYIVGLSIPLAIGFRRQAGRSDSSTLSHIISRSIALIVMGVFLVNYGHLSRESSLITKEWWLVMFTLGAMLTWLNYKKLTWMSTLQTNLLRGVGLILLIVMALMFDSGADGWFDLRPHWWGILGLIGWAYLLNAVLYLYAGRNRMIMLFGTIILLILNLQEFEQFPWAQNWKIVVSASNHLLVNLGVLSTMLYMHFKERENTRVFLGLLLLLGFLTVLLGLFLNSWYIISKILATPSWTLICAGVGMLLLTFLYWLVDKKGIRSWATFLKPAGTSTLTCYMIPFLVYPLMKILNFSWPGIMNSGTGGLLRSLLFAILIVYLTGFLEKKNIQLRI